MARKPKTDAHRWQAAMGAIVGSVAAEAIVDETAPIWGARACRAIDHAEDLLRGAAVPIDLAGVEAVPTAVGLASQASPLLIDGATVELIDQTRAWLDQATMHAFVDPRLKEAAAIADAAPNFASAIAKANSADSAHAGTDLAILAGALRGLTRGVGDLPARMVSTLTGPDGRRKRRYLTRLTDRLLGLHRTDWFEPRSVRGPREVLPGLWLSNLFGLKKFVLDHPDGLVLSLCDIEARLIDHPSQITFHLDDTPKADANPALATVLDDLLTEVAAARERGQPVLVHCRHGASRTGLLLRLVLMEDLKLDPDAALMEAQCVWPHTSTWNAAWGREVKRRFELAG